MPKPTRTPERISLPGGWKLELGDRINILNGSVQGKCYYLMSPDEYAVTEISEKYAQAFTAAMNGAAELTASKVNELATRRGKSILPQVVAAMQSPAGKWRDINTAERESGKEIIGAIFKGAQMLREPFTSFWLTTLNRFYANPTHYIPYPLPPAPTGEVE